MQAFKQRKRTCYVDDTQLAHWQGYVAGIPRVMYELGRRFTASPEQPVVHLSWVKEAKNFAEIDFEATMSRQQGIAYFVAKGGTLPRADDKPQTPSASPAVQKPSLVLRVVGKLTRLAHLDNNRVVRRARRVAAAARARNYKFADPQTGDILLITWGEWWDENFLRLLEKKAREGVLIMPIIHDVLPFTQAPQFSSHSTDSLMEYCRRIVPVSKLVLCVSQSTRNDLVDWLKDHDLPVPATEVFRLGEDFEFAAARKPDDVAFKKSGLKGQDYTLTVGTVEARKNHTLLYYVHKLAKQRGIELPKAVIVGRRGWKTEQIYDFITEDPEVRDEFIFMHNVSDEELSWLYDHALFSVFPSMYEGWGMPIAESLARGVPCACSNTTSMTEIAEGYVTHFSPFSTDECLAAIQALSDPANLKKARAKARQYKQTTWDEAYNEVQKKMEEAANA